MVLLFQYLSLLFLIGNLNSQSTNEEKILQFIREQKLGELLGHDEGDPQYEIVTPILKDRNGNKLTRSVKENYPEEEFYTIEGLGHKFDLHLKKNNGIVDKGFQVTARNGDGTLTTIESNGSNEFLYHGIATSHEGSQVAISTYNGLVGLIRTKDGDFIIDKLPKHLKKKEDESNDQHDHIIYKKISSGDCGQSLFKRKTDLIMKKRHPAIEKNWRNDLIVETAIFVDYHVYIRFQNLFKCRAEKELINFILATINAVQLLYNHPSLVEPPIKFILMKLEIFKTTKPGFNVSDDANIYLDKFCEWQGDLNNPNDTNKEHWDTAFLFTGLDLQIDGHTSIIGLAPMNSMCKKESCSVSEMASFRGVYVAAHEVGHNFGMDHDGDGNDCEASAHIMSAHGAYSTWSCCSKVKLNNFIRSDHSVCLLDHHITIPADKPLPGQLYNLDQQCKFLLGSNASHCCKQPISDVCKFIICKKGSHKANSHPALEGTTCGDNMWCRYGKCISKDTIKNTTADEDGITHQCQPNNTKPIDGGWNEWIILLPCKSHCDPKNYTHYQLSVRDCNNPKPQNGGRQCEGESINVIECPKNKSCSEESAGVRDFPSSSCQANQIATTYCKNFYHVNSGLQFNEDSSSGCKIWCQSKHHFNFYEETYGYFPDGTICHTFGKCLGGHCQSV